MPKHTALTDADYTSIGRRFSSEDVALEARESASRWARDVASLAPYGHGAAARATFLEGLAAHTAIREKRPQAVAAKTTSIASREAAFDAARAWVDKVVSVLGTLARTDATLAAQLNDASPATPAELDAKVVALARLLENHQGALPAEAEAAARLSEVAALTEALAHAPAAAATAKAAPVADTAELDLADGRLYVAIRDLNNAARKAVRAGALSASPSEYTFRYLKRSHAKKPPPPAT